jgi:hypothetical protein
VSTIRSTARTVTAAVVGRRTFPGQGRTHARTTTAESRHDAAPGSRPRRVIVPHADGEATLD